MFIFTHRKIIKNKFWQKQKEKQVQSSELGHQNTFF